MTVGSATSLFIHRIVTPVAAMHRTISSRCFTALGPLGKPIRPVHDATLTTVYESIRLAGSLAGMGIDRTLTRRPELSTRTQAVVNGLWGDHLGSHERRLEIPMSVRDGSGAPVPVDQVAAAFPQASPHLVILAHGFADTESCWLPSGDEAGLVAAIAAQPELTPIMIRYNTGKSVTGNGRRLASLVEDLYAVWPVPVRSIALVGHSMGGLVARQACAIATNAGHDWPSATTHVVTLGSPHRGTPIEKLVSGIAAGLGVARTTVPLQEFVETRSRGIKDLKSGEPVSLPDGISEHFIAGVVTADPKRFAGVLLGDLVVRVGSASGGPGTESSNVTVIGGVRHNELVRHADAINRIIECIQPPRG